MIETPHIFFISHTACNTLASQLTANFSMVHSSFLAFRNMDSDDSPNFIEGQHKKKKQTLHCDTGS